MNPKRFILVLLLQAGMPALLQGAEPSSVSSIGLPSTAAASGSFNPTFSADARFLLLQSYARNLTTQDVRGDFLNIYLKETASGKIYLISTAASGNRGGNGSSYCASISSNGQLVAFESSASNLVSDDTNGFKDIFVRDLSSGTTTLLTVDASGNGSANGDSYNPIITPDGRYVAFESSANNLVQNDTNGLSDVFVRDRLNGTTFMVSSGAMGLQGSAYGSGMRSELAGITPDGKRVLFTSTATNLIPGLLNSSREVFLRDLESGALYWVSTNAAAPPVTPQGNYRAFNPVMDDTGARVVYKALTDGYTYPSLIAYDVSTGLSQRLADESDNGAWPYISRDGKLVVSEAQGSVELWDMEARTNKIIAHAAIGQGFGPILSPDKTRAAFCSADQLVGTVPVAGGAQIYVYDFPSGTFRMASRSLQNAGQGDFSTALPSFDATGDLLAFDSTQEGLVDGDNNLASDVFVYGWSSDLLTLATSRARPDQTTSQGLSFSGPASVSANGRYVAFTTTDTNVYVSPGSKTNTFNLAVWDTWQRTNLIAQILTNVPPFEGGIGPTTNYLPTGASAQGPSIGLDGKFVTFTVTSPGFTVLEWRTNIFALNLETAVRIWIDRSPTASAFGAPGSGSPVGSADNRYVVYHSRLGDIPSNVPDGHSSSDIFLYDSMFRTNTTISVNLNGDNTANGDSINPLISSDGRWILFQSLASDLTTNLHPEFSLQEYVRDLSTSNTFLISYGPNGQTMAGTAGSHVFSLNGRVAAFGGRFNLDGSALTPVVFVYDLYAKANALICTNCQNPSLDAGGTRVTFETVPGNGVVGDVYAMNLQTRQSTLVSVNGSGGGGGNGISTSSLISSDARYVVFVSKASDLVANDNNGVSDVFVRDLALNKTTLLSLNFTGTGSGNGASARPALSADGRTVVFQSLASDLIAGDYNQFRDVFVSRLGGQDSDGDGVDDDWELAYFGNLSRDGSGDFDGDGQTDLQEFRAGTDPTNQGSVLHAMTLSGAGSSAVNVIWNSSPGKTYKIQYKDDLGIAAWNELAGLVTATSTTSIKQDLQPSAHRFYRVVLAE
ncbi:MAG TPA: hypothetical protein VMZ27_09075 [Candidatus Saccharimonadales bacterium]|nr:hypothetical protein [Candidatus Saccharimonadales bacterium]